MRNYAKLLVLVSEIFKNKIPIVIIPLRKNSVQEGFHVAKKKKILYKIFVKAKFLAAEYPLLIFFSLQSSIVMLLLWRNYFST